MTILIQACSDNPMDKKGFQVSEITENGDGKRVVGLKTNALKLKTRPVNVLLTADSSHRLIPVYKVNYNKENGQSYTGTNSYHQIWEEDHGPGNNWNHNFMPGFEAVYGFNFVNVSHYNIDAKTQNEFFEKPVLIKTLYYPTFSKDTLNNQPVSRNYYMVSAYNEDTNKDGFLNVKDLRRFFLFDINGKLKKELVPKEYSVMNSEYDQANDLMYIFARLDQNKNGQMELDEQSTIFWIDLKNPENTGVLYENK